MKRNILLIALVILTGLFSSCISIQNTGFSNAVKGEGTEIRSEASASGFLHLTTPETYDLERIALNYLKSRCEGKILSTTSRLEVRDFLLFQSYTIRLTGICAE